MSVLKKGRLTYSEPGGKKKNQVYECELWDNKVIDLTGIGKYGGVKKSINLVRCQEIEPDNYTSTRFTVQILGGYSHELQASTENDRTSWIDCICDLCGISNPLTGNVPKQKKTLPPLPPPKPISEEKRKEEERGIYEDMSDEGDDEEYIAPSSVGPLPPDEGGVLEYHYPSVDRRIRPASVHDYGGAPVTSSSGGGMFDHNEEDDDEYIDPTIPAASMRQIPQALGSGPGYMNTNTLNGKDLQPTKYSPKSFTLPHRSPSMKEKTPTHHVTARKPLTPPSSRKMSGQRFDTGGTSNELMDKLKRRKNKVEEDSDSVFEPTRPTPPTVHSKPVYQNTGLDKPPTIPSKATSPKPPSHSGKVSGSKPQNNSSSDNPSACPSWRQKQPQLPVQDPPWLKQKRDSKPSLPVQDPPWLEQKKASKDRFDNPYPLPTETAPAVANERRFDKPYPLPTETAVPSGHRFDKSFPLSTEQRPAVRDRGKWREKEGDSPPPPLPPGRTSSKRDMFEAEKSVSPADRKAGSRKPLPPPTCKKPIREVEDDFDFPTADQLRAKTYRFSQPVSEPQPPLPPRYSSSSSSASDSRSPRWNDSIDNRPPPAPPRHPYR